MPGARRDRRGRRPRGRLECAAGVGKRIAGADEAFEKPLDVAGWRALLAAPVLSRWAMVLLGYTFKRAMVDPLIRQLTLYRDFIENKTKESEP